jgi:hypothetical protein
MTRLRTLQQFTLENRRKTVNSSAIRSVKTSHVSTGAYSASDTETPQQKNCIPLCRTCAGPNFFVESNRKSKEKSAARKGTAEAVPLKISVDPRESAAKELSP